MNNRSKKKKTRKQVKTSKKKTAGKKKTKRTASQVASEKKHEAAKGRYTRMDKRKLNEEAIESKIRERAYELYRKRGGVPGNELRDWFDAEKMIEEEVKREP